MIAQTLTAYPAITDRENGSVTADDSTKYPARFAKVWLGPRMIVEVAIDSRLFPIFRGNHDELLIQEARRIQGGAA